MWRTIRIKPARQGDQAVHPVEALDQQQGLDGRIGGQMRRHAFARDDLGLRASAGLSVFWTSPLGPIRLDFSQVLAKEVYDKTETFRFSTSTQF